MAYQVLARKYRPTLFSDVVGQDHVTRTLLNALAQNRIAHGYIFSGHRGIGKTTIARILASALNCRNEIGSVARPIPEPCNACESCLEIRQGNAVDVIEIDAATNRGIEDVRELRDAARYRPSRDRFKIIILDEAHQITDAAFNALLKTLEEPPDHIVFMFATTQPEDIPQTIRSRCQHFSFHAVKLEDIVGQLRKISIEEHLLVDDATLSLLAEAGDGSMRDALSIMDQAIASAPLVNGEPSLELEQVRELMGSVSNVIYEQVLEAVQRNNSADVLAIIARLLDAGNGASQIARQFVRFLRNCVVAKITALEPGTEATGIAADLLQISQEERSRAARTAQLFSEEDLSRFLSIMLRTFDELGYRQEQRFHLELGLLKLVHMQRLLPIEDLLSQLGTSTPTKIHTTPTSGSAPRGIPSAAPTQSLPRPTAVTSATTGAPSSLRPVMQSETTATGEREGSVLVAPQPTAVTTANPTSTLSNPFSVPTPQPHPQPVAASTPAFEAARKAPQPTPPVAPESANRTEGALAIAPEPAKGPQTGTLDLTELQSAMTAALSAVKGQDTAAHGIEESTFAFNGDTVEIHTTYSKTMLPVVLNSEANKILLTTLRSNAPGLKLALLPGAPPDPSAKKAARPAKAGSAAELAEKHPVVQEARRLFSAEISNIIDLRDK